MGVYYTYGRHCEIKNYDRPRPQTRVHARLYSNLAIPKIGPTKIFLTQYADDLVLLDYTKIGLQKGLEALNAYNVKNELMVNPR